MGIVFEPLTIERIPVVSNFVERVFDVCIAPHFSPDGCAEFKRFVTEESFRSRLSGDGFGIVAEEDGMLVGIAEIRDRDHLAMFFVDPKHQQAGIGKRLLERVIDMCRRENPSLCAMTVCASPNAVEAYRHLGFTADGPEELKNGIRFTPMTLRLDGAA